MIKFLFVTDSHGDMLDIEARDKVLEFKEAWKPNVIIHGGDYLDLRSLRKGASPEEKAETLVDDVSIGLQFLDDLFKGRRKQNVLLLGNHDDRLYQNANSVNGVVGDYSRLMIQKTEAFYQKKKINFFPYDVRKGVFTLGKLNFIHGYRHSMNCAKDHALDFGNVIFGHIHRFHTFTTAQRIPNVGMSCGCLAKPDMPYLNKSIASFAHQNGFYYGVVDEKTGDWDAWSVRKLSSGIWSNPFDYIK